MTKLSGAANFALSANGSLVYEAGDVVASAERNLVWVDRQGREEAFPARRRERMCILDFSGWSRVALDIRDKASDIWVWALRSSDTPASDLRSRLEPRSRLDAEWSAADFFCGVRWCRESVLAGGRWFGKPDRLTTARPVSPRCRTRSHPTARNCCLGSPASRRSTSSHASARRGEKADSTVECRPQRAQRRGLARWAVARVSVQRVWCQ